MNSIRILHTADVHIGAPFEFLGGRGKDQRTAVREAFKRITGMASGEGFQVLLIAGDLFEAAYSVSDGDLSFVIGCIEGMGGIVPEPFSNGNTGVSRKRAMYICLHPAEGQSGSMSSHSLFTAAP